MASDGAGDADLRTNTGKSGPASGAQNKPAATPGQQNQQQQPNILESQGAAARSQAVVGRGEPLEVRKVTGLTSGRVKRKKDGQ